jgi:hypothetical protein
MRRVRLVQAAWILGAWLSTLAGAGPVFGGSATYLVQGIGAEGVLEIGGRPPADAVRQADGWLRTKDGSLDFRVGANGLVAIIRCTSGRCTTDRNVRVGAAESVVLQRYGSPTREKSSSTQAAAADAGGGSRKTLYIYTGASFAIQEGKVQAIYILAR